MNQTLCLLSGKEEDYPIELMAMSRNVYPCKDIEIAERLTGKKESSRFKEIPYTIKLRIIKMTRV